MKLSHKLFLSYLLVVAVGLLVVTVSTAFVAPATFVEHMGHMGLGVQRGMMSDRQAEVNAQLETNFRAAINDALLRAGIAAIAASGLVSWLFSQQITNALRAFVHLSQRIAGGQYQERLQVKSHDELAELAHSFNQMAEALDHTETLRRELLADVTHELKTPLASIKGYMEGLQDGVIPADAATFQLIHLETSRMQRLVEDLQELSIVEAGKMPIHAQASNLCRIVEAVVERLRPQFDEKDIALTAQLADSFPAVYADPDRIGQVLTNLLGNALQNTLSGGQVQISLSLDHNQARLAIKDTGVGLAPENLERIFQRFYRVDKSRARSSGGSGIGLTISRHLVEAHNGRIWAESLGLGRGSVFYVTLPMAENFTETSQSRHAHLIS
jgi:signal transduction histidine kinase